MRVFNLRLFFVKGGFFKMLQVTQQDRTRPVSIIRLPKMQEFRLLKDRAIMQWLLDRFL